MDAGLDDASFGSVTMVAALHHVDTRAALNRAVDMLEVGGKLYVLGLARIETRRDLAFAIRSLPRARIVGALRGEQWPDGAPVARPLQTFEEVRRDVEAVLVEARLRRRRPRENGADGSDLRRGSPPARQSLAYRVLE